MFTEELFTLNTTYIWCLYSGLLFFSFYILRCIASCMICESISPLTSYNSSNIVYRGKETNIIFLYDFNNKSEIQNYPMF